jgi:hypothetical protein
MAADAFLIDAFSSGSVFSTNVTPGSLMRIQDVQDLREALR